MSNITIYVMVIVITTLIILYIYYCQESQHQYHFAKIRALELKYLQKKRELEILGSRTMKCPVPDLNDPRSCYYGSNYQCSWNDVIGRCDKIQ